MRLHPGLARTLALLPFLAVCLVSAHGQALPPPVLGFVGARGAALGDAIGSDVHDIEGMYWNPASLSFLWTPTIMMDHRREGPDPFFRDNIAAPILQTASHAIGIGLGVESSGKLTPTAPRTFLQYNVDLGYSLRIMSLTPDVSLGVLGSFRYSEVDSKRLNATQFSIGTMYSPTPAVSYSFVARGIGQTLQYAAVSGPYLPPTVGQVERLQGQFEVGTTMRYPTQSRMPFLVISAAAVKDRTTRTMRVKGGIELTLWDALSLRGGYVDGIIPQFRIGGGLALGPFRFDYANMPTNGLGNLNEFTLKIGI